MTIRTESEVRAFLDRAETEKINDKFESDYLEGLIDALLWMTFYYDDYKTLV